LKITENYIKIYFIANKCKQSSFQFVAYFGSFVNGTRSCCCLYFQHLGDQPPCDTDEADRPTTIGEGARGEELTNNCHKPTTDHPKPKRPTPHTTANERAQSAHIRYPLQAVSTQDVEWGVEPVLKQPDLPNHRPQKRKSNGPPKRWKDLPQPLKKSKSSAGHTKMCWIGCFKRPHCSESLSLKYNPSISQLLESLSRITRPTSFPPCISKKVPSSSVKAGTLVREVPNITQGGEESVWSGGAEPVLKQPDLPTFGPKKKEEEREGKDNQRGGRTGNSPIYKGGEEREGRNPAGHRTAPMEKN